MVGGTDLSIKEAAALLGKSPRTVRHLAQTGRLAARRDGARWVIDRDALTADSPAEVDRRQATVQRVRDHVTGALSAVGRMIGGWRRKTSFSHADPAGVE